MIARDGFPFILGFFFASGVLLWLAVRFDSRWLLALGAVGSVLFCIVLFFFRDPERIIPGDPGLLVSPADGRITSIDTLAEHPFVGSGAQRIIIFLSPFNVHINRYPCDGTIQKVEYRPGKFLPAFADQVDSVNERNDLFLSTADGPVAVRQVAGFLARRIVCRGNEGDRISRGARFGMIKFSSRTDLIVPASMRVTAHVGDHVRGGETILARTTTGGN